MLSSCSCHDASWVSGMRGLCRIASSRSTCKATVSRRYATLFDAAMDLVRWRKRRRLSIVDGGAVLSDSMARMLEFAAGMSDLVAEVLDSVVVLSDSRAVFDFVAEMLVPCESSGRATTAVRLV